MHAIQYFSPAPPGDPRNYDILNMDRREIEMSTIHRSAWKTGSSELWRNLSMSKLGELRPANTYQKFELALSVSTRVSETPIPNFEP